MVVVATSVLFTAGSPPVEVAMPAVLVMTVPSARPELVVTVMT